MELTLLSKNSEVLFTTMDEEINEADKNQYHLDDDDFLSAPGGLLKDNESTHDSSEVAPDYSPNPPDKTIDINTNTNSTTMNEEEKTNTNIKLEKPTQIPYGISDDTSESSDDNDIANNRKYTHNSQPTEDEIDNNNN
eukprot:5868_1